MNNLTAKNISVTYGKNNKHIISNLSLTLPKNKITTIIGPNGSGKTTLLKTLAGLIKPTRGEIYLDGTNISKLKSKEKAKKIASLAQNPIAPNGLTVEELVARGRYPYHSWFNSWSSSDQKAIDTALQITKMHVWKNKDINLLSGGQRQRAWLAMVLAQNTDILLLDEPTTFLDLAHAIEILDLIFDMCCKLNKTIIMILHDLNLAAKYSDNIVIMRDGKIHCQGKADNIFNAELLKTTFDLNAELISDPINSGQIIVPLVKQSNIKSDYLTH